MNLEKVSALYDIAEYMHDEELTQALEIVAKIIVNPQIPPHAVSYEIVRLQAYATKFAMVASYMANVDKTDRPKKNMYYSAASAIGDLVAALKYLLK